MIARGWPIIAESPGAARGPLVAAPLLVEVAGNPVPARAPGRGVLVLRPRDRHRRVHGAGRQTGIDGLPTRFRNAPETALGADRRHLPRRRNSGQRGTFSPAPRRSPGREHPGRRRHRGEQPARTRRLVPVPHHRRDPGHRRGGAEPAPWHAPPRRGGGLPARGRASPGPVGPGGRLAERRRGGRCGRRHSMEFPFRSGVLHCLSARRRGGAAEARRNGRCMVQVKAWDCGNLTVFGGYLPGRITADDGVVNKP